MHSADHGLIISCVITFSIANFLQVFFTTSGNIGLPRIFQFFSFCESTFLETFHICALAPSLLNNLSGMAPYIA